MTRADLDAQRALFEAWVAKNLRHEALRASDGTYYASTLELAWSVWQAALASQAPAVPIGMVLHCPACGLQHIDAADGEWTNPPHRSHLCHGCNHIWRPADVHTNGVEKVRTVGSADSQIAASQAPALRQEPVGWLTGDSTSHRMGELQDFTSKYEFALSICEQANDDARYDPDHIDRVPVPLYAAPSPQAPAVKQEPWGCGPGCACTATFQHDECCADHSSLKFPAAMPQESVVKQEPANPKIPMAYSCAKAVSNSYSATCSEFCGNNETCFTSKPERIGPYSKELPSYGYYWHWTGEAKDVPTLVNVSLSGGPTSDGKYRRPIIIKGKNPIGFDAYSDCEAMGGYWAKAAAPSPQGDAEDAAPVQVEPAVPKNPYTIGLPAENWRRGYVGERFLGYTNSPAEGFYKEGKAARAAIDAARKAAPTASGSEP